MYTDRWKRHTGYVPPTDLDPKSPPWTLQPYARPFDVNRKVKELLRQSTRRLNESPDSFRSTVQQHHSERQRQYEMHREDGMGALTFLSTSPDNFKSRCFNLQDLAKGVWANKYPNRIPDYSQGPEIHAGMTRSELQQEVKCRADVLIRYDKEYLLKALQINSKAFFEKFSRLRRMSCHILRWLAAEEEVHINIFYPYSRHELAFILADKSARDAVDNYNSMLQVEVAESAIPHTLTSGHVDD
ncbi:hypothetical protein EJ07DRAFT_181968 [Lizonia empirigonia]|nr:hypothetical protein EJ07DRAFT_181968 [Lizonia empirigonia]